MVRLLSAIAVVALLVAGVSSFTNRDQPPIYSVTPAQQPNGLPIYKVKWGSDGETNLYSLHGGNEYVQLSSPRWFSTDELGFMSWTCVGHCDADPAKNNLPDGSRSMFVNEGSDREVKYLELIRNAGRQLVRNKWPEAFKNKQP